MWFLVPWHRAQPSPVRPTLQCFRRHRCPAAVAADSVARPVRTTTVGYPGGGLFVARPFWVLEKWGRFLWKRHGKHPKTKGMLIEFYLGPTALLYVTKLLCNKKHVDARFFFSGMFLAILLPPIHGFSRLQMLCGEAEKGGAWDGLQSFGRLLLLVPGNPRVLQKWVDTLGVCFLSQMSFFLQTSSKQKPSKTQALVANDGSLGSQGRCPV